MCQNITLPSELEIGELLELCDRHSECLCERFGWREMPSDLHWATFSAFEATHALVEFDVEDMDFRSELTASPHGAEWLDPYVERVHFFRVAGARGAYPIGFILDVIVAESQRENQGSSYRGYATIRPTTPATLGRCMLTPPSSQLTNSISGRTVELAVRTAVREDVAVFGRLLSVFGVPFLEQDGGLLRCAQVTAWIAHYTAVLRGNTPRRLTGAFAGTSMQHHSYPSSGLTSEGQGALLELLGLPSEELTTRNLASPRSVRWHDRQTLADAVAEMERGRESEAGSLQMLGIARSLWFKENFVSSITRYLNSGMPVILDHDGHSQVICGYDQVVDGHSNGVSEHTTFVVQDDLRGPFNLLRADEVVARIRSVGRPVTCLVPKPPGLWFPGEAAELAASHILEVLAPTRMNALKKLTRTKGSAEHAHKTLLLGILANSISGLDRRVGLRAYATSSDEFKIGFIDRLGDDSATEVVGYARLPRLVWVVEAFDRAVRRTEEGAHLSDVLASIVFSGAALPQRGASVTFPEPLITCLPGTIRVGRQGDLLEEGAWSATEPRYYASGRWGSISLRGEREASLRLLRAKDAIVWR